MSIEEPFRRYVRRDTEEEMSPDAARSRPMRTQEEIEDYRDRLAEWFSAVLSRHTTAWPEGEKFTDERMDQMDREMNTIPKKVKAVLIRLDLQMDVLAWVLNRPGPDEDIVAMTRERVSQAGVDLYELEDRYQEEECPHPYHALTQHWQHDDFLCQLCDQYVSKEVAAASFVREQHPDIQISFRREQENP